MTCFPTAAGRLDFAATTDSTRTWLDLFNDPTFGITEFGPGVYSLNPPIQNLGAVIHLFYRSSVYAQVNAGNVAQGSNFTLTSNYFNTFVLDQVGLFDSANNPIPQWTMTDLTTSQAVRPDRPAGASRPRACSPRAGDACAPRFRSRESLLLAVQAIAPNA